jgi:alpha-tubulin suppressor-like RCC1 family protein
VWCPREMKLRLAIGLVAAWVGSAVAADPPPSTAAVTQVAVVPGRSCGLHTDGTVSCWGDNTQQLLGPGTDPRTTPVGVPAFHDVVQLQGVSSGTCARLHDRTVTCLGMSPSSTAKLEVQALSDVVALGGDCVLHGTGEVSCFDGAWKRVAGITDAIFVDGEGYGSCVVHKDHSVSCWAENRNTKPTMIGAAADGSLQAIAGLTDAVEVGVGLYFACARLRSGSVSCWGMNSAAELGRGTIDATALANLSPGLVVGLRDAVELAASAGGMCARRKTGRVTCWGSLPWDSDNPVARPTEIKGLEHVTELAVSEQACVVMRGREVSCWGSNELGELGDGNGGLAVIARPIPGLHDAVQLDLSDLGTCALRRTGEVLCWATDDKVTFGRNLQHVTSYWGHLIGLDRDGVTWVNGESKPRPVPKATAQSGPCLIANGGEVWCSANSKGARKNPTTVRVGAFTDAVELAGHESVCIRHRGGDVSCFTDWFGADNNLPIAGISDAIALGVSSDARCAVRADHTVWCWGDADSVFLGHDPKQPSSFDNKQLPPARANVTDAVAIAMNGGLSEGAAACVIKLEGTVWCWGANNDGRLASLERTLTTKTPIAIRGVTDATQIGLGATHGCALQRAGTVVCWGNNEYGALGTPATQRVKHPVVVRWP